MSSSARVAYSTCGGVAELGAQRAAELAAGAEDEGLARRRSACTSARRGWARSFGEISTSASGIGQSIAAVSSARFRNEYVRVGRPVVVDEVGVGGVRLERLVGVADAARHEDRPGRVELGREDGTERRTLAQVDPGAEDPAGGDRDPLVPRLGVDAAGRADGVVERDVVLHRPEVGQAQRRVIFSRCQFSLNQPRASPCTGRSKTTRPGIGVSVRVESLAELASPVTDPSRRRTLRRRPSRAPTRPRCRGTTAIVAASPASKSPYAGVQPSSVRSLVESIA